MKFLIFLTLFTITSTTEKINVQETIVKVIDSQPATLTCIPDNKEITWRRENNFKFAIGANQNDPIISISKVGREDRGKYFCRSGTEVDGTLLAVVTLEVSFAPQVFTFDSEATQKLGEDAEFGCGAISFPVSKITWYKNRNKLNKTDNNIEIVKRVNIELNESFLNIKNLTENDFGEYVCEAENELGKNQITLTLNKI